MAPSHCPRLPPSSVYVRVLKAASPLRRSISVMSLFHSSWRIERIGPHPGRSSIRELSAGHPIRTAPEAIRQEGPSAYRIATGVLVSTHCPSWSHRGSPNAGARPFFWPTGPPGFVAISVFSGLLHGQFTSLIRHPCSSSSFCCDNSPCPLRPPALLFPSPLRKERLEDSSPRVPLSILISEATIYNVWP